MVDLSALWAGPLCGEILAQCGARVIKVESASRLDGARSGPEAFFHLLNAGKESVVLDLGDTKGRRQLARLLEHADIVIESSRARGMEQMGMHAGEFVAARPGMVWLSISGYGRTPPMRDWIAYGDDAGVGAGLSWLVGAGGSDPVFCGDAIADPLTGVHAALLACATWRAGGGVLLDVPLHDVAAWCASAGHAGDEGAGWQAFEPSARPVVRRAVPAGFDTARICMEFSLGNT